MIRLVLIGCTDLWFNLQLTIDGIMGVLNDPHSSLLTCVIPSSLSSLRERPQMISC